MRKPLSSAPVLDPERIPRRPVLADLNLRVVTPMFGGGVSPGQIDLDQIIRPSAIRGHLRFWWRACNAARFISLKAMHQEERLLWGSATQTFPDDRKAEEATWGPGLIGIDVTPSGCGKAFKPTEHNTYVTWPFQQDDPQDGRVDVTFRLRLTVGSHANLPLDPDKPGEETYPSTDECKRAAAQSLWAWITFGGVGSRTRRGCGSLHCTGPGLDAALLQPSLFQPPANQGKMIQWFRDRYASLIAPAVPNHISNLPQLAGCRIAIGEEDLPLAAWEATIGRYRSFVDSLNKSPIRGELGLPRAKLASNPARMASSIVIKALPVSATRAVPLVLLLQAPFVGIHGGEFVRDDFVTTVASTRTWTEVRP